MASNMLVKGLKIKLLGKELSSKSSKEFIMKEISGRGRLMAKER